MLSALSLTAVAAGLAVAALAPVRLYVPVATVVATGVSLGVTLAYLVRGGGRGNEVLLAEDVAMVALLFLVVRRGPARQAAVAAVVAAVAGVAMIVPDPPPDDPFSETAAGIGFWLLFAFGAIGAALYLNALDARRARSVAEARRSQRLELARDLHDYVAHDVSGIVVQAQAAQVVAERDPGEVAAALKRIEEAGVAALSSMDRSLRALRELDDMASDEDAPSGEQRRRYGLEDLPDLTERFAATGAAEVRLALERELVDELPPHVSETGYRVAVEALTNVRRHARSATRVDVAARREGEGSGAALVLTIVDNGAPASGAALGHAERRGGSGLIGLRERVVGLGGTLTAGCRDHGGWEVRAVLPLAGGVTAQA